MEKKVKIKWQEIVREMDKLDMDDYLERLYQHRKRVDRKKN